MSGFALVRNSRPYSIALVVGVLFVAVVLQQYGSRLRNRRQTSEVKTVPPRDGAQPDQICEARIRKALEQPTVPGTPRLELNRGEILARARGESVLFRREPKPNKLSSLAAQLRAELDTSPTPWTALESVLKKTFKNPELLRRILLHEDYFYVDTPTLAVLLTAGISLGQLFTDSEISVTRGNRTRRATRRGRDYVWLDAAPGESEAKLWLFDRVYAGGGPSSEDFHVSIAPVRDSLRANAFQLEHLTDSAVVGRFEYGTRYIQTLLRIEGNQAVFDCERVDGQALRDLRTWRTEARIRELYLAKLRETIESQMDEAVPFDEPKTEEGQQDGKLRLEWRAAYLRGENGFKFNGDNYPVFDPKGRPRQPQVCVDFITDSWERTAGTHFLPRGEERKRVVGRIDFDALEIENRRSVENMLGFASDHPEWFEVLTIPEPERIPFANRHAFFEHLQTAHRDFAVGDVIAILGKRDDERLHYHSFFIVADEPITGIPTLVASNAGRPRIRTWEAEMQNAPRRAIIGRIRPRLRFLSTMVGPN